MSLFKILWGIDALAGIIVVYFFFVGLSDRSVSQKNMGLWVGILFFLSVVLCGSILLKRYNYPGLATPLLFIIAIPASLYLLFLLVTIFSKSKWN